MEYLTTGQAAKLLMVTRDAVLKWIKQGKLQAVQTAGGHYRIPIDSLQPAALEEKKIKPNGEHPPLDDSSYCWEYFASDGKTKSECRSCLVYKVQGAKCYEVGRFLKKIGFGATCCPTSCQECSFYREIVRLKFRVLVVTENKALKKSLEEQAASSRLDIQIARWDYDCGFIVGSFRPEYVIVDCHNQEDMEKYACLCDHLVNDPRIPGVQLLLAVPEERKHAPDLREDITVIGRPLSVDVIEDHIRKLDLRRTGENRDSEMSKTIQK